MEARGWPERAGARGNKKLATLVLHRAALLAREAVLPREHAVAEVPHHDHGLITVNPAIDNGVAGLARIRPV